ncbi:glucose-6-phosphate isomerase [Halorhodospira halochloris]|uniref:Glucose-6-phosphate isomerase n=1 Tax=Halorhodospira halochloris TaxID=1052 RepID=A0A110B4M4_HALHR|nr:glucose-6-phosphate isomerase [Halorhodospira halochloris]MBK1652482.1 glucose-6-phosphate isomerase [Halorhodospira halochloris]BAU56378.1 glucose-6-phosphate isomerase [Halorhodospira halochloris]
MSNHLGQCSAWRELISRIEEYGEPLVSDLFAADSDRFRRYSCALEDLLVDLSRHALDDQDWQGLFRLAEQRRLNEQVEALFSGNVVNLSEGRPALHTALRQPADATLQVEGEDITAQVHEQLARMGELVTALRAGQVFGFDGRPITDIVSIGIGGSECGVTMAYEALAPYAQGGLRLHTVSGVDGRELLAAWSRIDPATTLFVVASKSFTTQETLTNARSAWQWLEQAAGHAVAEQFVGISVDDQAMADFGIPPQNRFFVWEWVGGRYSLPSAMGLPLAAVIGMENFRELLQGMHDMDTHFRSAPMAENIPVMLGLLGVWQISLRGASGHALLPYHPGLRRFPAYVQQLDMESLGKSVTQTGEQVDCSTGAIFWGEIGSNAQHSFFQWLHQGTGRVITELVSPVDEQDCPIDHQALILSNVLGQAEALALGRTPSAAEAAAEHRHYSGNRPVTLVLFKRLDPRTLGRLVAMHEHRVFVQAAIWGINPFDQWGVELGKQLAKQLVPVLRGESGVDQLNPATAGAIDWIKRWG